jgi:hypothetical protein
MPGDDDRCVVVHVGRDPADIQPRPVSTLIASAGGVTMGLYGLGPVGAPLDSGRLRHLETTLVEAECVGEKTGRRLGRLASGSASGRRASAAVKNACDRASSS